MNTQTNIGVYLCKCGKEIDPLVDLNLIKDNISREPNVSACEIMPYPCMKPGMEQMLMSAVRNKLNRVVIAGCESRLMMKKLEDQLEAVELRKGQIDMVNLRDHVAKVSDLSPAEKGEKGIRLIKASLAEMRALVPTGLTYARIEEPVAILGGGASSFTAAAELSKNNIRSVISFGSHRPEAVIANLHYRYPGHREYEDRLHGIRKDIEADPKIQILPPGELVSVSGITGDYTLRFANPNNGSENSVRAGAVIACMDCDLEPLKDRFSHNGKTVLSQPEFEDHIRKNGVPKGHVIFWVNDAEAGFPEFGKLSAASAWNTAKYIRERSKETHAIILYNPKTEVPITSSERTINRKLNITWIPYDETVIPTVQDKYMTFCSVKDHVEYEIPWDYVVLSPDRVIGESTRRTADLLGLTHRESAFLSGRHAKVRPEMIGREESYLAGSARQPCDLDEALVQGRRAAKKTVELIQQSQNGEIVLPRIVCVVDQTKCVGCGMCQELCECGGISVAEAVRGGLPRIVDPMYCTGGGTCMASCPYNALTLQNNSTDQREAKVGALAKELAGDDILAIACSWGGLPAADNAGIRGLRYDPRVHIVGVTCIGQIDPSVMARAFLNGASGLILVGCNPEQCHHSKGVDHAWSRINVIKKLLTLCGFDRRRIALAHADMNQPKEFIQTVESFSKLIRILKPIEKTPENQKKLQCLYELVKNNSRVRHLLCANLRRPGEDSYKGDQHHALEYDTDFTAVLEEELLRTRLIQLLSAENRPLKVNDLVDDLHEDKQRLSKSLWDMLSEGVIHISHKNNEPYYMLQ